MDKPWGPLISDRSSCAKCMLPCTACRKCDPFTDPECDAKDPLASAKFCTACDGSKFFPMFLVDLDTAEQYFQIEASMAVKNSTVLTVAQKTFIARGFNRTTLKMGDFFKRKVLALPDGT